MSSEKSQAEYQSATITLQTAHDTVGEINAEANQSIVSALCGDCQPAIFTNEANTSISATLGSSILIGLLAHDILLEWYLSGRKGNDRKLIDKVHLPSLDFAK